MTYFFARLALASVVMLPFSNGLSKLSEREVTDCAEKYIIEKGIDVQDSGMTVRAIDFYEDLQYWIVLYGHASTLHLGDHFGLQISDKLPCDVRMQKGL